MRLTRRVGGPRPEDSNHRGVAGLERDALRERPLADRERDVGAAATTGLGRIALTTVVVVVAVIVFTATALNLVVILAAGARSVHELNTALTMRPRADHQKSRKAQTKHEQNRPDRDLAGLTQQLTA